MPRLAAITDSVSYTHLVEAHRMVFEKKLREVAYFGLVDGELRAQRVRSLLAGGNIP